MSPSSNGADGESAGLRVVVPAEDEAGFVAAAAVPGAGHPDTAPYAGDDLWDGDEDDPLDEAQLLGDDELDALVADVDVDDIDADGYSDDDLDDEPAPSGPDASPDPESR